MQSSRKIINKAFVNKPLSQSKSKREATAEEVLQEDEMPKQARRVQNFVKSPKNEALVEIAETDEPSITVPPKQRITEKPDRLDTENGAKIDVNLQQRAATSKLQFQQSSLPASSRPNLNEGKAKGVAIKRKDSANSGANRSTGKQDSNVTQKSSV